MLPVFNKLYPWSSHVLEVASHQKVRDFSERKGAILSKYGEQNLLSNELFLYEGVLRESKTKMKTQLGHSELCIMNVMPLGEAGLSIKINLVGHHL